MTCTPVFTYLLDEARMGDAVFQMSASREHVRRIEWQGFGRDGMDAEKASI